MGIIINVVCLAETYAIGCLGNVQAVRRLQNNGMALQEAQARVASQATNEERMEYTSLVLSTMTDKEQTRKQQVSAFWFLFWVF